MIKAKLALARGEANKGEMLPLPHCLSYAPNKTTAMSARASQSALSSNKVPKTLKQLLLLRCIQGTLPRKGRDKNTLLRTTGKIEQRP